MAQPLPLHAPRILLSNEPRSYRETIAAALSILRPAALIALADPTDFAVALARDGADLIVCSQRPASLAGAPAWLLIYPDDAPHAELIVGGHRSIYPNFRFADLLALLDYAANLAQIRENEQPDTE